MKHAGHARWFRAFVALVFLASTAIPAFMWIDGMKAYAISPEVEKVIGDANKNLSAKFSFDQQGNKWQFNKNGAAALAANIAKQQGTDDVDGVAGALSQLTAKQVGGAGEKDTSLYSVDLPVKAREGITYYDNVNKLSFKMVPDFGARDGKLVQDRIVYPFGDGAQVVYTAQVNGMKEDIVLSKYVADTLRYSYNLELPETLEAKLLEDGSIGIYSANVALFGNISFSGDADKARVMDARKNGTKDNLVFSIPPPFIKDQTGNAGHTKYLLNGSRVTVVADQLKNLKYPLTVDPSVTVTTSNNFALDANNEGGGSIDTADQLTRGALTGGGVGSWTTQTAVPAAGAGTCGGYAQVYGVHNGYFYMVCNTTTSYARLNSNGTINGTWQTGTAPPSIYASKAGFIYNGYMYLTGGYDGVNAVFNTYYIKLNDNGTMGASWTPGSNTNTRHSNHQAVAYNGYAYVSGGNTSAAAWTDKVEMAEIRADGSLGAWVDTTAFTSIRTEHVMRAYNGFMYTTGGLLGGAEAVQYAPINSDGTLGAWTSSTTIPTGASNPFRRSGSGIHNGYWYIVAGCDASCTATSGQRVLYAPVHANGQVGEWQQATTLPTNQQSYPQFAIYNNYIFSIGGANNNVYSSPINSAGTLGSFGSTNVFNASGRWDMTSVAASGYLYTFGGRNAATNITDLVRYAAINVNGSVGTWNTATSFVDVRYGMRVTAHGNNIYLVGGNKGGTVGTNCTVSVGANFLCPDVQRATINESTGALTWSGTYTYSATPRFGLGTTIVNNYIYVIGGAVAPDGTPTAEVNFAPINPDGTLGGFNSTLSLDTARYFFAATSYGGRIYATAGRETRNTEVATINPANGQITDWVATGNDVSGGTGNLDGVVSVAHKGYVYVTGGRATTGSTYLSTTQIARINSDGTLGNWSNSANSFTTARYAHGSTMYNDYLYVIGGCGNGCVGETNIYEDTQYANMNNGGSGTTGVWTAPAGDDLPAGRSQQYSFVYNDRAYAIGGIDNSGNNYSGAQHGYFATFDKMTGSKLTGWTSTTNAPGTVLGNQNYLHHNGYVYQLGGRATSNATSVTSVNFTQINSGGTFGTWQSTSSLNTGRSESSVVASGNYIYIFGGCAASSRPTLDGICSSWLNTVEVGTINPANGQITSWSLLGAGSNFTAARSGHQAVSYNGYVYLMGGCTSFPALSSVCDGLRSDVQIAKLNGSSLAADAGCGSVWCSGPNFAVPRREFIAQAYNGYLYIGTGYEPSLATVQRAPISANGSIDKWEGSATSLTAVRKQASSFIYSGRLYIVAGNDGPGAGSMRTDVQRSALNVIPRVGMYSKLLTISPTTDVAGVYYNGLLPPGSSVTYRVAPSSGAFGAITSAVQGSGSEPTPLCGLGTIYYVQLMATINDTTTAVFPDADGTAGNVTDFTVYYRLNATPPPNLRMTGGKWFYNEMQRELDTCKA